MWNVWKGQENKKIAQIPIVLNSSLHKFKPYVVDIHANSEWGMQKEKNHYYTICYTVGEDIMQLVWITKVQYEKLRKIYELKGSFSKALYQNILLEFKN